MILSFKRLCISAFQCLDVELDTQLEEWAGDAEVFVKVTIESREFGQNISFGSAIVLEEVEATDFVFVEVAIESQ